LKFAATMPGRPASIAVGISGAAFIRGDRQDANLSGAMELKQLPTDIGRHHQDMACCEAGYAEHAQ
jgi:hypothetical protein